MTSTLTTNKNIEKPAYNDYATNPTGWSGPVNTDWDIIDRSLGGTQVKNPTGVSGTVDLTVVECQPPILIFGTSISGTATLTANILYRIPSGVGGVWTVYNNTTGAFTITVGNAGGGTSVVIPQGSRLSIYSDGTNIRITDSIPPAAGSNTQVQYNSNGYLGASATFVYDGSGNVGIGTASPASRLDVSGAINSSSNISSSGNISSTGNMTAGAQIINTSGGYRFPDNTVQTTAAQTVIPSGSVLLFYQAAAPTGWTQVTTVNDRALRVVSGSGGVTGGTTAYSTYFNGSFSVGSTTITEAQMPSHTHAVTDPGHTHGIFPGGGNNAILPSADGVQGGNGGSSAFYINSCYRGQLIESVATGISISATGSSTGHAHTIPSLQYADVIICSKN
jgi:hypothetical protein